MRLSFVAIALSFTSVLAQSCTSSYVVQLGDDCNSICRAQGVPLYQLLVLNSQINNECTNLMPDESLCLRTPDADCKDVYTVIPNDTCEKVASDYGVDLATFWYNNPLLNKDCTNLYIDEVICVSNEPINYNPPGGTPTPIAIPPTALVASPTDLPWCD